MFVSVGDGRMAISWMEKWAVMPPQQTPLIRFHFPPDVAVRQDSVRSALVECKDARCLFSAVPVPSGCICVTH